MLSYFSGPGSLKANTQWDASSQSCMYPADGSSKASLLAGNLYMDLNNGTYLCRVLVCSLARLMFCSGSGYFEKSCPTATVHILMKYLAACTLFLTVVMERHYLPNLHHETCTVSTFIPKQESLQCMHRIKSRVRIK